MQYQFREIDFEGKVIRFIKPFDFDSDGPDTAPLDELYKIAKAIEEAELYTIVVVMHGQGDFGIYRNAGQRAVFINRFWQGYRRLPDNLYDWDSAES